MSATAGLPSSAESTGGQATRGTPSFSIDKALALFSRFGLGLFARSLGRRGMFAAVNIDGDGVLLRRAGCAAAVGDVFFQQLRQPLDDIGMIGLDVVLLANVVGQIEELD